MPQIKITGPIQVSHGLKANLPTTGLPGQVFFCTDTRELFVWNPAYSEMTQITGGGDGSGSGPVGWTEITGKPAFASVATSGNYADLSGKPVLGSAASQNSSAFDPAGAASTAQAASLQKTSNLSDLPSPATARGNLGLSAVAATGSYNDLSNKPTIPNPTPVALKNNGTPLTRQDLLNFIAGANVTISDDGNGGLIIAASVTGGGGSVAWGSVSGTLSAQADLQAALNLKTTDSTLATVAKSGNYSDLTGKPTIPAAQVNSDWNAVSGTAQILNKPTLGTAASHPATDFDTAGAAAAAQAASLQKSNNLSDLPSPSAARGNLGLAAVAATGSYSDLTGKPALSTVATTGSYTDLANKPSIPAAQVNSDWAAGSGVAQILNKPSLATVATSGSYNDLSNKPSIPSFPNFVTGEVVAGTGILANTPTAGSVELFVGGQRMTLTDDYTISGATITALTFTFGTDKVIANYRY